MNKITIINASIITPTGCINNGTIRIGDERIEEIIKDGEKHNGEGECFNAQGLTAVPGFIDLQLNGGFGENFTIDPDSIWSVAPRLLQYGVTCFLPTIISCPPEKLKHAIDIIRQGPPAGYRGPSVPGLHIEGPFLSADKKGAHNPDYFQMPDKDTAHSWHPDNGVRLVTLAPELEGALPLVERLVKQGITVSAGHSNATYTQARNGIQAGISMGTHIFNAMPPLNHREPGLVGALLEDAGIKVGIIADGIHVHSALVSLVAKIKGLENLILVSDAMSALGMPPGIYNQINDTVYVDETSAKLSDGSLAGSILSMDVALRNLISFTGCSLADAIPALTGNPAECIGENKKGEISAGYDADLVFLDQELRPVATMVAGRFLWKAG